jgi:nucleotide-binding universal stress UspA family protein
MKVLIAYDGTLQSKEALRFGIEKARQTGARLAVLHVFDSNMFIDYGAGPGAVEEARRQSASQLRDARAIIRDEGRDVDASLFTAEGDPEEAVLSFAKDEDVDLLLCTHSQRSIIRKYGKTIAGRGKEGMESMVFGDGKRGGDVARAF